MIVAKLRAWLGDQPLGFNGPLHRLNGFRSQQKIVERALTSELDHAREELSLIKESQSKWLAAEKAWNAWCQSTQHAGKDLDAELDTGLRSRAFLFAVHYWEARWLLEMREQFRSNYEEKKSVSKQEKKWRRYAKLTPAFVSTLFMLPKFFQAWPGAYRPLYNFIDLLIIDESGQVVPEVGAPAFALAKRAIVVGDSRQIEPVHNVSERLDRANIADRRLGSDQNERDWFLESSGLSASVGSLLQLAENLCPFQSGPKNHGLFLSSHFRCVDDLIAYCNELAYDGALQPQRGARDPASILPTWGYAHVPGTSRKYAKSRSNLLEVEVIADWIKDNFSRIRAAYPHEKQDDLIGVITPFSRQAVLLSAELAARGISGVTVGTVHRLQGAQRRVIIFSPVYDRAEAAAPFINRSRNMMNVAVSSRHR